MKRNELKKPVANHVTFYRTEGRYNFLNPKEESAQYVFRLPHLSKEEVSESGLKISYLVDLEKDREYLPDDYTALEVAREIKEIFDSYFIHSGQKDIDKLVQYLELIEGEQEELRHQHQIENAKYQISYWTEELERLVD